ncbi:MAG: hypothetical protein BJ554DRAFT_8063, partial [Olpidium bornovanus]
VGRGARLGAALDGAHGLAGVGDGLVSEELLDDAGRGPAEEVRQPVHPVPLPITGHERRPEHAGRVEGSAGYRAAQEAEEPQREADGEGGETGFGVGVRGVDGKVPPDRAVLDGAVGERHRLRIAGVDLVERGGEDDVDEEASFRRIVLTVRTKRKLHHERMADAGVAVEGDDDLLDRTEGPIGGGHGVQPDRGGGGGNQLDADVEQALADGHLPRDDGGEGDCRVEVRAGDVGEAVDEGDGREGRADGPEDEPLVGL